jgi:hypothetical protein
MTLKEESVIEMIAYKRPRRILPVFSMIPIYNSENELSHCIYTKRCYWREIRKRKEQLIRELTQNNKDLKQFSHYLSQPQGSLSNLTGLLNLIDDIPVEHLELKEI